MYDTGSTIVKYHLDSNVVTVQAERIKEVFMQIITEVDYSKEYIEQQKLQKDFKTYSQLSPVGKRKMLRRIIKEVSLTAMSYEQAKLYHRLKGRIK